MIDTALLIAGALTAARYFTADTPTKSSCASWSTCCIGRIDWRWAQDDSRTITAGLEARMRIPALRLGGLQRSDRPIRAGAGLADPSARRRRLRGVDRDLPVGEPVRPRFPVRGAAVHPPVLARMDRLSRHPRPLHAREATATISRTAAARPRSSASTRGAIRTNSWATTKTAGASPHATARADCAAGHWRRSSGAVRLRRARRAVRSGRRHARAAGQSLASLPFAPEHGAATPYAACSQRYPGDAVRAALREQLQSRPRPATGRGLGFAAVTSGSTRASW